MLQNQKYIFNILNSETRDYCLNSAYIIQTSPIFYLICYSSCYHNINLQRIRFTKNMLISYSLLCVIRLISFEFLHKSLLIKIYPLKWKILFNSWRISYFNILLIMFKISYITKHIFIQSFFFYHKLLRL